MFVGIEGSKSYFGNIPPVAQDPTPSRLLLKFGSCQMFLKTGPVQVQRYILGNTWVKIEREVTANRGIKLKPNTKLNIRMASQLSL